MKFIQSHAKGYLVCFLIFSIANKCATTSKKIPNTKPLGT
jgi:hypothetical protein